MENKHTPEPLSYGEDNDGWYVARGNEQIGHCLTEEDARRIVACVNACAGINTEALEHRVHLLKAEDDQIATLTKQRDELLAALEKAYEVATEHDDRLPFDWAVYCEMLYRAIANVKGNNNV